MANFTIPYTTPGNYTFDSDKVEVVGGIATLKDLTTPNARLYNSFDVGKDANWADVSKVGTLNGSPTFSGGKMVCTGSQGVLYNADTLSIESWKVKYTPNYTGSPPSNVNIISSGDAPPREDRCVLTHSPSGDNFRITLHDNLDVQLFLATAIGPSGINLQAGTEYEIEVVINSSNGTIRLFLDGNLHGTLNPGSWSRGSITTEYRVGANPDIYNRAEASFNDYIIFDNEQHTSSYTPGYSPSLSVYATDEPTIFKTTGNSLANIEKWNTFSETLGGGHQGTVNYQLSEDGSTWKYWNGSDWVNAGSGNYNGFSVINDNIDTFPATADAIFVRAFLISDGDQVVELNENGISFTINTDPIVFAGANKTAIYNVAISPFSDATTSDDEGNITKAEYKLIDSGTWIDIPKGSHATFQDAIRALEVTFTHSGEKELQLRITDSFDAKTIDSLIVDVDRVNITVNVTDEFGSSLPNVTFDPGDGSGAKLKSSPFILDYKIGTFTYISTKPFFDDVSNSTTITTASTSLTVEMTRSIQLTDLEFNIDFDDFITKGDTFFIDVEVINKSLVDWKIRCEVFDNLGNCIKLGTSNVTGGSDDQINMVNPPTGEFVIKIAKDLTTNFNNRAFIEVELENPEGQKRVIWEKEIYLQDEQIDWDDV